MKFCYFNPMPWPNVPRRPDHWPFPNSLYDANIGIACYDAYIQQFVLAEQAGFDWLGVGEDHMTAYSLTPNPSLIVAILSRLTRRPKLAILGVPLPLLNPIRVAEEGAMLDVLSGGRLVLGLIRGVPQNYAAYNCEPNESRSRFAEAHDLIVKAWTTRDEFAWLGEHYRYPQVSIWPLPLQTPHPPFVYSANSVESAIAAASRRGIAGSIHLYSRDSITQLSDNFEAYRTKAEQDGWRPNADRFLVGVEACIASTDAEAERILRPALSYRYNVLSGTFDRQKREIARTKPGYGYSPVEENPPTLEERLECSTVICGSASTVIRQIERISERLGAGIVSLQFQVGNLADEQVRESIRLFSAHVISYFSTASNDHGHHDTQTRSD